MPRAFWLPELHSEHPLTVYPSSNAPGLCFSMLSTLFPLLFNSLPIIHTHEHTVPSFKLRESNLQINTCNHCALLTNITLKYKILGMKVDWGYEEFFWGSLNPYLGTLRRGRDKPGLKGGGRCCLFFPPHLDTPVTSLEPEVPTSIPPCEKGT